MRAAKDRPAAMPAAASDARGEKANRPQQLVLRRGKPPSRFLLPANPGALNSAQAVEADWPCATHRNDLTWLAFRSARNLRDSGGNHPARQLLRQASSFRPAIEISSWSAGKRPRATLQDCARRTIGRRDVFQDLAAERFSAGLSQQKTAGRGVIWSRR
jgi:hypothetical protein